MPLGKKNRSLSGAEARKIASTPLSERLNLMALDVICMNLQRRELEI
ncbi:MAG: hypothetical protein QX196_10405 [Methylococcaceae bacterium]